MEIKKPVIIHNGPWVSNYDFWISIISLILLTANIVILCVQIKKGKIQIQAAEKTLTLTKFEIDKSIALIQPFFNFRQTHCGNPDNITFDVTRSSCYANHFSVKFKDSVDNNWKQCKYGLKFDALSETGKLVITNLANHIDEESYPKITQWKNKIENNEEILIKISYIDQLFTPQYQVFTLKINHKQSQTPAENKIELELIPKHASFESKKTDSNLVKKNVITKSGEMSIDVVGRQFK